MTSHAAREFQPPQISVLFPVCFILVYGSSAETLLIFGSEAPQIGRGPHFSPEELAWRVSLVYLVGICCHFLPRGSARPST